jgi:hypothetical protein
MHDVDPKKKILNSLQWQLSSELPETKKNEAQVCQTHWLDQKRIFSSSIRAK